MTAFQAFHWFDHAHALTEIVRILRPGGRAAVVYNERDESDPFTAAYGALVRRLPDRRDRAAARRRSRTRSRRSKAGTAARAAPSSATCSGSTADGVHARARSTSYLPHSGPEAQALHAAIDALFDAHARDGRVTMVLTTIVVCGDVGADGG